MYGAGHSRAASIAAWCLLATHLTLLALSLPNYPVSVDSAYHVSLARYYAEHGTAFWDHINYGPRGRPNLQGPALHYAIAVLGWALGGEGDGYVLANAILAVLQWTAAMLTAMYFARRYGGDWAALFAVALLSGSLFAAGSFFVGLPSGWLFILTPWAIHFFLERQPLLSALVTAGACYVHLGGFLTAPFGVFLAAALTRRWLRLAITGALTVALTSPYLVHFFGNIGWYVGQRGHEAVFITPLIYVLAVGELVRALRRWHENIFLLAWFFAPLAWVVQDYTRFLMQADLAGAVLGGLFLAWLMQERVPRRHAAFAASAVALATVFPLSLPALPLEAIHAAGFDFPRFLDWQEARRLAEAIDNAGLERRLVSVYDGSFAPALAVYVPLSVEKGHWREVRPRPDPAEQLSAGIKVYVIPAPPADPVLAGLERRGWVRVHGGGAHACVMTLDGPAAPAQAAPVIAGIIAAEADWLAAHAVNNTLGSLWEMLSRTALAARRQRLLEQRARMGRIEAATLVYAYALEPSAPQRAASLRGAARAFGEMARFLGDDSASNFISGARHQRFRANLARLAAAMRAGPDSAVADRAVTALIGDYFAP